MRRRRQAVPRPSFDRAFAGEVVVAMARRLRTPARGREAPAASRSSSSWPRRRACARIARPSGRAAPRALRRPTNMVDGGGDRAPIGRVATFAMVASIVRNWTRPCRDTSKSRRRPSPPGRPERSNIQAWCPLKSPVAYFMSSGRSSPIHASVAARVEAPAPPRPPAPASSVPPASQAARPEPRRLENQGVPAVRRRGASRGTRPQGAARPPLKSSRPRAATRARPRGCCAGRRRRASSSSSSFDMSSRFIRVRRSLVVRFELPGRAGRALRRRDAPRLPSSSARARRSTAAAERCLRSWALSCSSSKPTSRSGGRSPRKSRRVERARCGFGAGARARPWRARGPCRGF